MEQGNKNNLKLKIITPEKVVYNKEIISLTAPGQEGYFGVLSGHAPMVNCLKKGICKVKGIEDSEISFDIEGGFLVVENNDITILADSIGE